jgi:hypothetical protein
MTTAESNSQRTYETPESKVLDQNSSQLLSHLALAESVALSRVDALEIPLDSQMEYDRDQQNLRLGYN